MKQDEMNVEQLRAALSAALIERDEAQEKAKKNLNNYFQDSITMAFVFNRIETMMKNSKLNTFELRCCLEKLKERLKSRT
jgi:CRISPR/Cas system-associated endonuclease Cas3-HD